MTIPLLDLAAQYRSVRGEIDAAVRGVLEAGHFILGPCVAALEKEIASYLGVAHGVGVASGTDALVLALRALDIGPGDEVVVPAYTFFASAGAVMLVGAKPVFVDVRPDTYCIDVKLLADRITPRTKAVMPVHLFGCPADLGPILELSRSRRLAVIEDNAQAFGAESAGRKTGSFGDVGCLSFFPSKNLAGFGDGGMVVTDRADVAERIRKLRTHGWKKKYFPEELGFNSRLDELQAAIVRVHLRHVDRWNDRRRELAARYTDRLAMVCGTPAEPPHTRPVYHLYTIRTPDREAVMRRLAGRGIASAVYYPQPPHLAEPCKTLGHKPGDFPVAERACDETLALPLFPEMTEEQVDTVADAVAGR